MTAWQLFMIIVDVFFTGYYLTRIKRNNWKWDWNVFFLLFWAGFLLHDLKII